MNTAPVFKPLIYQNESEWRFVVGNSASERTLALSRPLKFRARGENIVPYVELDISPNANLQPGHLADRKQTELLPIAEVVIGSRVTERNETALKLALETYGYSDVLLKRSLLPMA